MKKRIIDCSIELFCKYGIKGVTMDDIATELGISKRTLYEHFECKEQLLTECLCLRLESCKLFDCKDNGLIDELVSLYVGIRRLDIGNVCRFCCDLRKFHYSICKALLIRLSGYTSSCAEKVEVGIADGYIRRTVKPNDVYSALSGYLAQLFTRTGYDHAGVRQILSPETILIFTRGLCTIKGRAYLDKKLKESVQ